MTRSKIVWGVCGIGHGHIFRQLPLLDHFAQSADICLLAYGESDTFFRRRFADNPNVQIQTVSVPFYVGNENGLDFAATAALPANQRDHHSINMQALTACEKFIGKPDLVVTDYEPISAQYAYAYHAPLVTIDQQSKYLCGSFPDRLNSHSTADEVARLRLFFPKADLRLATSFFAVAQNDERAERVTLCPPVLSDVITGMTRQPSAKTSILVYISAQQPFTQRIDDLYALLAAQTDVAFHVFGKNMPAASQPNITIHPHGDAAFHQHLAKCNGIISTAGHSLLSEAMYLNIPVLAVPLPVYEQQMNAAIIQQGGFGLSVPQLTADSLQEFIRNLPRYSAAIEKDETGLLLRGNGRNAIIPMLQQFMP